MEGTAIGRRIASARATLADFLAWWRGELLDMVPAALRERLRNPSAAVTFCVDEASIEASIADRHGRRLLGSWTAAAKDGEDKRAWASRIRGSIDRRRYRVGLRVPSAAVLHRRLVLPQAVLENLRQSIGYDLDRLTPYRAEDVLFDARLVGRDPGAGTCTVELVVVPRAVLSGVLDEASRLAIRPDFIEARADDSAAPVDLLSLIDDSSKGRGVWVTRALAILAVLLGVTILAIPVLRQRAEIQQVLAVLDAARSQAEYASRLRQEIDELEAARSALHGRQRQAPDALQIFHALTILLPDDTYLSQWEIVDGRLQITGYARSASAVLTAIEASPLFQETAFRAPVTQSPQDSREHFQIVAGFSVEGGS